MVSSNARSTFVAGLMGEGVLLAELREVSLSQKDESGSSRLDRLGHCAVHCSDHTGQRTPASGQVGLPPLLNPRSLLSSCTMTNSGLSMTHCM